MTKQKIIAVIGFTFLALLAAISSAQQVKFNHQAIKAPQRLLMDIKKVGVSRLVSVGERGHILVSDDNGQSWQQKLVPTDVLLTKLFFFNEKEGWAVGHRQSILKTSDGGESWVLQHQSENLAQPALFDIWFKDGQTGFAVGAYGLYLQTQDGGESWESITHHELENPNIGFPHFYSIAFDSTSGHLYLAGEIGFLAQSTDFGETWTLMENPYDGSFFNMASLPNQDLLVMGLRGHLFRSEDQGETWVEIETGTIAGLQEALVLKDGRVLIVGSDGTQLLSNDYGKSVRLEQRQDRVHLASAIELSSEQILVVGINGVSHVTFDWANE
jgi:photosystem II stability/assembly factor-like uncharacterized protein